MLASRHRCQDDHNNGCAKTIKDDASNLLSVSREQQETLLSLRPHPQVENKQKYVPCPKSSSDASWRDLSEKEIQQKSITISTQRKKIMT